MQTTGSTKLYKLNATTNKTGLEFVIKVMAGDKIDIFGKSYYLNTTNITNSNSTPLDVLSLMTNFLLAPVNPAAGKGFTASTLNAINSVLIPSTFFRGSNSEPTTQVPKAYINYIFLDEQFKYVGGNYSRVGSSGSVKDHWYVDAAALQNITVPKNGYIFVYVSNESNFDVFFDKLQVIHKPGPILEETHYYPFGLTMSGISSKALNGAPENKYKYNKGSELQTKEFSDGSGLELYATNLRSLDPQLGRWWQIDSKPDYAQSLYSAMNNNSISFNDPLGDTVRVDETITGNKLLNSSFNAFAATKEGRKFLTKYAAKGQTIGGHTFKKEGKYSKQGVDVNYNAQSFEKDKGGETERTIDASGRGEITVSVNSNFSEKAASGLVGEALGKVETLFHESFIHVDLSTKDYLDNGKFDYSNISQPVKNAAGYSAHYQHYKVLMDYMKNGYNTNNLWPGDAFKGMKQLNDILKVFPSDQTMLNDMWDYSGGIQLDENGNIKQ